MVKSRKISLIYFMLAFIFGFIHATVTKEDCDTCVRAEECALYGNMNRQEQKIWLEKFQCTGPKQVNVTSTVYGFSPTADGDYVCCSNNVWGIHNNPLNTVESQSGENIVRNRHPHNPVINDSTNINGNKRKSPSTVTYPRNRVNENKNHPYDNNNNRNYNGQRLNNVRNTYVTSPPYFLVSTPRVSAGRRYDSYSYFPKATEHGANSGEHCSAISLTNLPPRPETGCCGKEATETDGNENIGNRRYDDKFPNSNNNIWQPREPSSARRFPDSPGRGFRSKRASDNDFANNVPVSIDDRITGGKETELYEFPWTVLLKTTFDYTSRKASFNCGGSLISSRYVLTAGHCVVDSGGPIDRVEITLSEYDKRTFPKDCKLVLGNGEKCVENVVMFAEKVIIHPQYNDDTLYNDIALIRLRDNAPYTDFIRPICLPNLDVDNSDFFNLRLAVAGWGRNGSRTSNIKQSTVVNLVPHDKCKQFYPELSSSHLCAAGYNGEDTCKGDSGGPLMAFYRGQYYVVGIVSGKRADSPCGTSVPSLYTNVFAYIDWITKNIVP